MKNSTATEKIIDKIEKAESKLAVLESKRTELDNDIKECKSEISKLKEQLRQEKLNIIANTVGKNGVSIDDLLAAAESGDFLTLQEKLEESALDKRTAAAQSDTSDIDTAEKPAASSGYSGF